MYIFCLFIWNFEKSKTQFLIFPYMTSLSIIHSILTTRILFPSYRQLSISPITTLVTIVSSSTSFITIAPQYHHIISPHHHHHSPPHHHPITSVCVGVVQRTLAHRGVRPRAAALEWTLRLHTLCGARLAPHLDALFPVLLMTISDPADVIVKLDLEMMVRISANEEYFQRLMLNLLNLFERDAELLTNRAAFIIRLLSKSIDPIKLYCSLAYCLESANVSLSLSLSLSFLFFHLFPFTFYLFF